MVDADRASLASSSTSASKVAIRAGSSPKPRYAAIVGTYLAVTYLTKALAVGEGRQPISRAAAATPWW